MSALDFPTAHTQFDPHVQFPNFYNNSAIQSIAHQRRWTISDNNKMPIDIRNLVFNGMITGAHGIDHADVELDTLDELTQHIPTAHNHAYYHRMLDTGFVIVDIEPSCPESYRNMLFQLPHVYAETSMSGRGYHLIIPVSNDMRFSPVYAGLSAVKHDKGWVELLFDHWITFTRNDIDVVSSNTVSQHRWEQYVYDFVHEFSKKSHTNTKGDFSDNLDFFTGPLYSVDYPLKAFEHHIDHVVSDVWRKNTKELSDFSYDTSRLEYSKISSTLHACLDHLYFFYTTRNCEYQLPHPDYLARWIYQAIYYTSDLREEPIITYRDKHDSPRNGYPWILYTIFNVIDSSINYD